MTWKKVVPAYSGDTAHFGGVDINRISDFFSGVADVDGADLNSTVKFRDQKLVLRNPANTFSLTVKNPVITANMTATLDERYSYLIFIDADDSSKIKAKNGHTGAIDYSDTNARVVFNNVFSALSTTGGLVFVKQGEYDIDQRLSVGVLGTTTSTITIQGEHRDGTKIKFINDTTPADMLYSYCNLTLDSLTFDGNGQSLTTIQSLEAINSILIVNCHFVRQTAAGVYVGNNSVKTVVIRNNFFDQTAGTTNVTASPQCRIGTTTSTIIENNYFDKSSGTSSGNNISILGGANTIISGNIIRRSPTSSTTYAIIATPTTANTSNLIITGNIINSGSVSIGDTGVWTFTFNNITASDNIIVKGDIRVVGPDSSYTNSIRSVNISNNMIIDPPAWGIRLKNVAGPSIIIKNQLRNSNLALSTPTTLNTIISLTASNNIEAYGNTLVAIDNRTNANPGMLYYETLKGARFYHNRFINQTGNSSTITPIFKAGTGNTDVYALDNEGAQNIKSGTTTFSGNNSTKTFVINHGLDKTPDWVILSAGGSAAKGDSWVDTFTSTTFTVNFALAPPSGTNNVVLYYTVAYSSSW